MNDYGYSLVMIFNVDGVVNGLLFLENLFGSINVLWRIPIYMSV